MFFAYWEAHFYTQLCLCCAKLFILLHSLKISYDLQFSVPTDVINLCGKIRIRKPRHYGGQECKQTEPFSAMTTVSDYFLSLDEQSKRRYKVKINIIQGYDPYHIKKEELSSNISKFPLVTYPDIVNYLLSVFTESTDWGRTKSVRKFGLLRSFRIRMGQGSKNKVVWRNYLGYWTGQYLMFFLLHFTVLY